MSKSWRLTRQAEATLLDIADWTTVHFGTLQAAAYEQDLIDHCTAIAAGTALSRSCRQLIDPDLPEDLRFVRCSQHLIVFIDSEEIVTVVEFLHARRDLLGRISALAEEIGRRQ